MGTLAMRVGHAGGFDTIYRVTQASICASYAWASYVSAASAGEVERYEFHIEGLDILGHRVSMKFAGSEVRSLRLFVPRIRWKAKS